MLCICMKLRIIIVIVVLCLHEENCSFSKNTSKVISSETNVKKIHNSRPNVSNSIHYFLNDNKEYF